jgi:hypothetical protein
MKSISNDLSAPSSSSSKKLRLTTPSPTAKGGRTTNNEDNEEEDNEGDGISPFSKDDDEMDDNCFICGMEGELLICDYPDCPRVYHSVCILKIAPKPLSIDTAYDGYDSAHHPAIHPPVNKGRSNGLTGSEERTRDTSREREVRTSNNGQREEGGHGSHGVITNLTVDEDNLWFCPKHFCNICGVLESSSKGKLPSLNPSVTLPNHLYLYAKERQLNLSSQMIADERKPSNLYEVLNEFKTTKTCRSCPFTLCNDCENDIVPHSSAFKTKRGQGVSVRLFCLFLSSLLPVVFDFFSLSLSLLSCVFSSLLLLLLPLLLLFSSNYI